MFLDEDLWFLFRKPFHVRFVDICPEPCTFDFWVFDGVVAVEMFVSGHGTKGPANALNLPGFRHHQAVPLDSHLIFMTLPARFFVDPRTARIGKEFTAVSFGFVGFLFGSPLWQTMQPESAASGK